MSSIIERAEVNRLQKAYGEHSMAAIFHSEQARLVGRALMDARVRLTRAIEAENIVKHLDDTFVSLKDATLLVLNDADATIQWCAPNDITSWTPSPDAGSDENQKPPPAGQSAPGADS